MIWLFIELLAVLAIVATTVFWGLDSAVSNALNAALERSGEIVRDALEVRQAEVAAAWNYAAGIGAMMLGRLVATRRRPESLSIHLMMPAVACTTGLGLVLQWGYADPLRASGGFFNAPGFAPGVLAGGLLAGLIMALPWDPAVWADRLRVVLAVAAVAALVALAVVGEAPGASGAKVRLFGVQPIEGVKLAFVLFLAVVMGRKAEHLRYQRDRRGAIQLPRFKLLLPAIALLGVLFLGLFAVSDLGPTLILSLVFVAFYYVVTRSWVELLLVVLALAAMVVIVLADPATFLPGNVVTRIEMWRDPWLNGRGGGDQLAASLWAFAAGGWLGMGWGEGAVGAIPTGHTDLILAHLAEVVGLVGLGLYWACLAMLVFQGMWVGLRNRTPERMLMSFGLAMLLLSQGLIIFSGATGLLPLTGVVVPFLSYGKTSMVTFLALVGLVVRLAVNGRVQTDRDELRQLRGGIFRVMIAISGIGIVGLLVGLDRTVLNRSVTSTRGVLAMGWDDRVFLRYDPRIRAIARQVKRGDIRDRKGALVAGTDHEGRRIYPLGAAMGTLLGPVGRGLELPSWAIESRLNSHLRGLEPADSELSVWVEQRPDDKNQATGESVRVADRILFSLPTHELRAQDEVRARALKDPESKLLFTRIRQVDYTPLARLARLRGVARKTAIQHFADDVASRSVQLTIDATLQQAAAAVLAEVAPRGLAGAAVVIDVDSGEVLARAQWPDFDPGAPETWLTKRRENDPKFLGSYGPWRDKTGIGGFYQTGSVFKVFTSLAWVRSGLAQRGRGCGARGTTTFHCTERDAQGPFFTRPDWPQPIHDSHFEKDGVIELTQALEVSCNVFFGQLGLHLGPEPFRQLVADGLEVDGKSTMAPGQPGSRQLASTAFGQGVARMHAMEVARMVAVVGGGGLYRKCPPSMQLGEACQQRQLVSDASLLEPVLSGMRRVAETGTARRFARIEGVRIYAKTGTATDIGRRDEEPYGIVRGTPQKEHSWLVALAESDRFSSCNSSTPGRLAFAAVVPRGGAGSGAALEVVQRLVTTAADLGYF